MIDHYRNRVLSFFVTASMCSLVLILPGLVTATDWPADIGQDIGKVGKPGGLPSGYEPSGAVWHPLRGTLIVVDDDGKVSEMNSDGGDITTWVVNEDLEGVTFINPTSNLVYLAVEQPDTVLEFDLKTGLLTGNQWDLTPWLTGPSNRGLEALTYVDGSFYAGLQVTGEIFVFDLLADGDVHHQGTIAPHLGRNDLSGLHYDACTGVLYAVYDRHDKIVEMTAAGEFIREYDLAGQDQEGVAQIGGVTSELSTLFIAEDSGRVQRYDQYPAGMSRELPPDSH